MANFVLKNIEDIDVAVNEVITRFSFNRNSRKLLDNDIALAELYDSVFAGLDISTWNMTAVYAYDSLVWYLHSDRSLWLLRSTMDGNVGNNPGIAIDKSNGKTPDFSSLHWENQNEFIDVLDEKYGILESIRMYVMNMFVKHEQSKSFHRFGSLYDGQADSIASQKILKRDLSNIDAARPTYFFPQVTGRFSDDTITAGTYRIWENGIIEFDLTFRLGYRGKSKTGYDVLSCNDVNINVSLAKNESQPNYNTNGRYFKSVADMKIFNPPSEVNSGFTSVSDKFMCGNRNEFVNSYSADLNLFPESVRDQHGNRIMQFKDTNYMIFAASPVCEDKDMSEDALRQSSNQLTWCNKSRSSVTALFVTFRGSSSGSDFATNAGLASNVVRCHIIGRF